MDSTRFPRMFLVRDAGLRASCLHGASRFLTDAERDVISAALRRDPPPRAVGQQSDGQRHHADNRACLLPGMSRHRRRRSLPSLGISRSAVNGDRSKLM